MVFAEMAGSRAPWSQGSGGSWNGPVAFAFMRESPVSEVLDAASAQPFCRNLPTRVSEFGAARPSRTPTDVGKRKDHHSRARGVRPAARPPHTSQRGAKY